MSGDDMLAAAAVTGIWSFVLTLLVLVDGNQANS